MAEARGDVNQARIEFEESSTLLRRTGETRRLILALAHLSGTCFESDPKRAERIISEALALAEASGDLRGAAIVKGNLAEQLLCEGDDERAATRRCWRMPSKASCLGDVYGAATSLASLAALAHRHGDLEVATANLRESLQLSHSIRDTLTLSWTLVIAVALLRLRTRAV